VSKASQRAATKKLPDGWRPTPIVGFQEYRVTIHGNVFRQHDGIWWPMVQFYKKGVAHVALGGNDNQEPTEIPVWHIMCIAYGGGNPEQYDVIYNDGSHRNLHIRNLSFVEKSTQGRYFSTDLVAERDRPKAKTDKPKTKPKPIKKGPVKASGIAQETPKPSRGPNLAHNTSKPLLFKKTN